MTRRGAAAPDGFDLSRALARCSLAAGAAGAALAGARAADAEPTAWQPVEPLPIVVDALAPQVFVDLDGDETADLQVDYLAQYGGSFGIRGANDAGIANFYDDQVGSEIALRFEAGAQIDETLNYRTTDRGFVHLPVGSSASYTPFVDAPGFVGLALSPFFETRYGYLRLEVSSDGSQLALLDGAFESELDTPIVTVPEPAGLAGLAAGAATVAALAARRRRRPSAPGA